MITNKFISLSSCFCFTWLSGVDCINQSNIWFILLGNIIWLIFLFLMTNSWKKYNDVVLFNVIGICLYIFDGQERSRLLQDIQENTILFLSQIVLKWIAIAFRLQYFLIVINRWWNDSAIKKLWLYLSNFKHQNIEDSLAFC